MASKRGLKNIDFPLHEGPSLADRDGNSYAGWDASRLLMYPIVVRNPVTDTWTMAVSWADIILMVLSTFLTTMVYAVVWLLAANAGGVTALSLGLISIGAFYLGELFAQDDQLRGHVSMVLPWAMIITGDYGFFTALLYSGIQIGAASAGGAIAKALGVTTSVLGSGVTPTTDVAWWLSFFAASSIAIFYVLIQKWRKRPNESNTDNHARAVTAAMAAIFVFTIAFFGANAGELRTFEPAMYFANYVATGFDFNAWMYIVLLTFAPAVAVLVLYLITLGLKLMDETEPIVLRAYRNGRQNNLRAEDADGDRRTVQNQYTDARQRQARNLNVEY